MTNLLIIFVVISTIITTIINFIKPAYKSFVGKYSISINIVLSFVLGILASFSVAPYLDIELNNGLLILVGLALGTGSTIWFDVWEIIKGLGDKLKVTNKEEE